MAVGEGEEVARWGVGEKARGRGELEEVGWWRRGGGGGGVGGGFETRNTVVRLIFDVLPASVRRPSYLSDLGKAFRKEQIIKITSLIPLSSRPEPQQHKIRFLIPPSPL